DQRKRQVRADGLRAVSHFQVLEKDEVKKKAKLLVTLETGRTHQIRVHLSASGWPIVGDPLYNPNFAGEDSALTGWQLNFVKPYSFNQVAVRLDKK
ncbi:MAG: pseudouridine synthase, partial [Lactobacillus delbrueckii]